MHVLKRFVWAMIAAASASSLISSQEASAAGDTTQPLLSLAAPAPVVADRGAPEIRISYSDAGSGIDLSTVWVTLDGFDIISTCIVGTASATCAPGLLSLGQHSLSASVADRAGNQSTVQRSFVQRFTVDHARAAAVELRSAAEGTGMIEGHAANGGIVWLSTPAGTWGWRQDEAGRDVERVDELGNRITTLLDSSGRTVQRTHEYNQAGNWTERYLLDEDGEVVVSSVDGGVSRLGEAQSVLGLAVSTAPASLDVQESADGEATTSILSSSFASVTHWASKHPESLPEDVPYASDHTSALGESLTVWMEMNQQGIVVADDHGGSRLQTYDQESRLVTVEDELGPVLAIERDLLGRPTVLFLGELTELHYAYQADGTVTKTLLDSGSGQVLLVQQAVPLDALISPEQLQYQPSRRTVARLPGWGNVVEWDELLGPGPFVTATLSGQPYALLPTEPQGPLPLGSDPSWRSITLDREAPLVQERIDYRDDKIVLRLSAGAAGPDSEAQTAEVVLPRRPQETVNDWGLSEPTERGSLTNTTMPLWCGVCYCVFHQTHDGGEYQVFCGSTAPVFPNYFPRGTGGPRIGGPGGQPRIPSGNPLPVNVLFVVNQAKAVATDRLNQVQKCRDLFKRYPRTGLEALRDMRLRGGEHVRDSDGRIACDEPTVPAWTILGTPNTYICDKFTRQGVAEAATTMIHEALHTQGLGENPPDPRAMTPAQINQMVREACFQ